MRVRYQWFQSFDMMPCLVGIGPVGVDNEGQEVKLDDILGEKLRADAERHHKSWRRSKPGASDIWCGAVDR